MCGGQLLRLMLITKLHPTCIRAGIPILFFQMVSIIDCIEVQMGFITLPRLKGRIESGCGKIQHDSAIQLFVQPVILIVNVVICH